MLSCAPGLAFGQYALEIISLRHRTVEQVLPVLQPLLEPGGTLTGQSGQLIVRTSPRNLAELRSALEIIDRPLRRLQISVRFDNALDRAQENFGAAGRVDNRGVEIDVLAQERRQAVRDAVDQRIQVIEGGRAFIATGQSRSVPQRQIIRTPGGVVAQETIVVQEALTGFDVVPRLSGSRVVLEIAPQRDTLGASSSGSVQSQRLTTTVETRLGEWTELGSAAREASRDTGTPGSAGHSSATEARSVWVKVEALD